MPVYINTNSGHLLIHGWPGLTKPGTHGGRAHSSTTASATLTPGAADVRPDRGTWGCTGAGHDGGHPPTRDPSTTDIRPSPLVNPTRSVIIQ